MRSRCAFNKCLDTKNLDYGNSPNIVKIIQIKFLNQKKIMMEHFLLNMLEQDYILDLKQIEFPSEREMKIPNHFMYIILMTDIIYSKRKMEV